MGVGGLRLIQDQKSTRNPAITALERVE
jgi:hypothetical protein